MTGQSLWRPLITSSLGRCVATGLELQWPSEVDVALREGNLDALYVECGIDLPIKVAYHVQTTIHIADNGAQLKIE